MVPLAVILGLYLQGPPQEETLLEKLDREIAGVVKKVRPSVVSVVARFTVRPDPKLYVSQTLNLSGIVYRQDGYVVTDGRALEAAGSIRVTTGDGRTLEAKLIAVDAKTGIAVLRVEAGDLVPAEAATQDLRRGSLALAVGNSYGLEGSASVGTLSGTDRSIRLGGRKYDGMLQLSVPVHPGDCGGFVADVRGRLIGIVHSTFSADDASPEAGLLRLFNKEGRDLWPASPTPLVFATPVDTVAFVADRIIKHRKMVRGRLGVSAKRVEGGIEIVKIEVGSPARKAGLRKGDVLLACDGEPVGGVASLQAKIERLEEPRVFKMRLLRDGVPQDIDVQVEIEVGR